jgi:hypothetical protein
LYSEGTKKHSFGNSKINDSIYDLRSQKNSQIVGRKDKNPYEKDGLFKFRNN